MRGTLAVKGLKDGICYTLKKLFFYVNTHNMKTPWKILKKKEEP